MGTERVTADGRWILQHVGPYWTVSFWKDSGDCGQDDASLYVEFLGPLAEQYARELFDRQTRGQAVKGGA